MLPEFAVCNIVFHINSDTRTHWHTRTHTQHTHTHTHTWSCRLSLESRAIPKWSIYIVYRMSVLQHSHGDQRTRGGGSRLVCCNQSSALPPPGLRLIFKLSAVRNTPCPPSPPPSPPPPPPGGMAEDFFPLRWYKRIQHKCHSRLSRWFNSSMIPRVTVQPSESEGCS
jgi:hypothetical protein